MLDSFRIATFRFSLSAVDRLELPSYKGSVLRGGFGHVFKSIVCSLRAKDCDSCMLRSSCIYAYVFETPPPNNAEMMRLYPSAPHPFVIEPHESADAVYEPGAQLVFNLILIGKAIDYLPYFVYTFVELGKRGLGRLRGKYSVDTVASVDRESRPMVVYDDQSGTMDESFHRFRLADLLPEKPPSAVTLELVTPTRIRFEGNLSDRLDFHVLMRALLRRISSLSYFHCGEKLDIDFRETIARARDVATTRHELRWVDWQRYSGRQKRHMTLGGVVGQVQYDGELADFVPFIRLGEIVHVGKACAFGLGKYRVGVGGRGAIA